MCGNIAPQQLAPFSLVEAAQPAASSDGKWRSQLFHEMNPADPATRSNSPDSPKREKIRKPEAAVAERSGFGKRRNCLCALFRRPLFATPMRACSSSAL